VTSGGASVNSFRYRVAGWVMRHRRATAVGFLVVTAIFAMGIRNVQIQTILSDLLPEDDSFVQVYKDHPNFGNPLTVTLIERWCVPVLVMGPYYVLDIQTGRMTRLEQVHSITGGHTMSVSDTGIYDRYLTSAALMRLGDA